MFAKKYQHPNATTCTDCHAPHGSATRKILKAPQSKLCLQCHDVRKVHLHPFGAPAKDPRTGGDLDCTSCHSPHSSDHGRLLLRDQKRDLCVQCHLGPNMEVRGRARKQ
jgi:predicted CXXCH cytochrome family protein